MILQEVGIMSMLAEHPHMVRLKQVLYAPHRLYIVTGYLTPHLPHRSPHLPARSHLRHQHSPESLKRLVIIHLSR